MGILLIIEGVKTAPGVSPGVRGIGSDFFLTQYCSYQEYPSKSGFLETFFTFSPRQKKWSKGFGLVRFGNDRRQRSAGFA